MASKAELALRGGRRLALLAATAITAAVAAGTSTPFTDLEGMKYLGLLATFVYGSGGTTVKGWVQTSLDGGTTWRDVASFAFTTASGKKTSAVHVYTALAAAAAVSDGALADDTILNGLLGDRLRVKYTTTGTYGGTTTLQIDAIVKG